MLTIPEGDLAVRLARQAIEDCLRKGIRTNPKNPPTVFDKKRGVFVTIKKNNNMKELRGCIGRPYPVMPLKDAIIISAINAARDDNRFTPLTTEEIDEVVIEVTVLTVPKCIEVKPEDIPDSIEIGRHGLIVITGGRYAGLLLPQVAVEHGFDSTEFLCQTCMKAGLMPDAWLEGAEVYLFEGQIFEETEPGGKVREKILSDGC